MAKKVTISLFVILIVAAAVLGLALYNNSDESVNKPKPTAQPTKQTYIKDYADKTDVQDIDATQSELQSDVTEPQQTVNPTTSDNTDDITTSVFSLDHVFDNQTQTDVPPRVVFGSGFRSDDCYVRFNKQGNFEMRISGFSSETSYGTYTENNDIISVSFEDGTLGEYDVVRDDIGNIMYVIVPYNEYSLYFS